MGVAREIRGVAAMQAAAAEEARRGGGWVKLIGDYLDRDDPSLDPAGEWTVQELRAVTNAAHDAGARVAIHAMTAQVAQMALAAGVDSLEHGCGLTEGDLTYMSREGIAWTPTLAAFDRLLQRIRRGEPLLPAAFMESAVASTRALVPVAAKAGVVVLCGTDGIIDHGRVANEVLALMTAGLDVASALRAATLNGWSFLGLGLPLSEGAPADALIFDRNPLEDPGVILRPTFVISAGRIVARATA